MAQVQGDVPPVADEDEPQHVADLAYFRYLEFGVVTR